MYRAIVGSCIGAGLTPLISVESQDIAVGALIGAGLARVWEVCLSHEKNPEIQTESKKGYPLEKAKEVFHRFKEQYLVNDTYTSQVRYLAVRGVVAGAALMSYGMLSTDYSDEIWKNLISWGASSLGLSTTAWGLIQLLNREEKMGQDFVKTALISGGISGLLAITSVALLQLQRKTIGWNLRHLQYQDTPCTTMAVWLMGFGLFSLFDAVDKTSFIRTKELLHIQTLFTLLAIINLSSSMIFDYTQHERAWNGHERSLGGSIVCGGSIICWMLFFLKSKGSPADVAWAGILGVAAAVGARETFDLKFPGSVITIGCLAGGLISSALGVGQLVRENPETKKRYQEGVSILLGSACALTVFDQVTEQTQTINTLAGLILMPLGGLLGRAFLISCRKLAAMRKLQPAK